MASAKPMIQLKAKVTRSRMRELSRQGRQAAYRRNVEIAETTVKIARQLVPVSDNNEPGHVHLRDTIRVEKDARRGTATAVAGDPEKGVSHAVLVEEGTTFTDAQPYMRPAAKAALKRSRNRRVTLFRG